MSDRAALADLLEMASEFLRRDFGTVLDEDKSYALAMVARAMTIASRGIGGADGARQMSYTRLYPDVAGADTAAIGRRLVNDIRAGAFDQHYAGRLRAVLLERTVERLRISNPDALAASGLG